jgi:hypothetical protein
MRNPLIQKSYAKHICAFNFNKLSNKYVAEVMPYKADNLFIHQVIKTQGPGLISKIDKMKEMLGSSAHPEHVKNLKIANDIEKTFLFEGYLDFFSSLVPKGEYSSLQIQ